MWQLEALQLTVFILTQSFNRCLIDYVWWSSYAIKTQQFNEVVRIGMQQTIHLFYEIINLVYVESPKLSLMNIFIFPELSRFVNPKLIHFTGTWKENDQHDQFEKICKCKVFIEFFLEVSTVCSHLLILLWNWLK